MKRYVLLVGVWIVALSVRLFSLDTLPGEWFGDISIVHEYVMHILSGDWPYQFFLSAGPLYHYLIAPIIFFFPAGYLAYKVAAVLCGIAGLFFTYQMATLLSGRRVGLLTLLVMSYSLNHVIWSRLGNSQILVPALSACLCWCFVYYVRCPSALMILVLSFVSSLGWYLLPQSLVFVPLVSVYFIGYLLMYKNIWHARTHLVLFLVSIVVSVIPWFLIISSQVSDFTTGYVGKKVFSQSADSVSFSETISLLGIHFVKTVGMLFTRGDVVFTSNVSGKPHIDHISSIFFVLGVFMSLLSKKRWRYVGIIGAMIVFILPSISPGILEIEIPSSSRTIAILPFVYFFVAWGIDGVYRLLVSISSDRVLSSFVMVVLVSASMYVNMVGYFFSFAYGLPDHNVAWGRQIARYIDTMPASYSLYFGSCCWGSWGHPEPKGIAYILRVHRHVSYERMISSCDDIIKYPAIIILGPKEAYRSDIYRMCAPYAELRSYPDAKGDPLFFALFLRR